MKPILTQQYENYEKTHGHFHIIFHHPGTVYLQHKINRKTFNRRWVCQAVKMSLVFNIDGYLIVAIATHLFCGS